MSDEYLRAAQILVLEGQERSLTYLREGGDLPDLIGAKLGDDPPKHGPTDDDSERIAAAMASPSLYPRSPSSLSMEFLEEGFNEELRFDDEKIAKEITTELKLAEAHELLEDFAEGDASPVEEGELLAAPAFICLAL